MSNIKRKSADGNVATGEQGFSKSVYHSEGNHNCFREVDSLTICYTCYCEFRNKLIENHVCLIFLIKYSIEEQSKDLIQFYIINIGWKVEARFSESDMKS